jgi:TolB protein
MRVSHVSSITVVALVVGCTDGPTPPPVQGSLSVAVATTGGDLDPDGYVIALNGAEVATVEIDGTSILEELRLGEHSVELRGIFANCAVVGENPRTVAIAAAEPVSVEFEVGCVGTGVNVVISTVGVDLPSAHLATFDHDDGGFLPTNGSRRFGRLLPGVHTISLEVGADNCAILGSASFELTVDEGQNPEVSFSITCGARWAAIVVHAATTGLDRLRPAYAVSIDGAEQEAAVPREGKAGFMAAQGDHVVELSDVPANCMIDGGASRAVTVVTGGLTRDTTQVAYAIECSRRWSLVFTRSGSPDGVYLADAGGADTLRLVSGLDAEWSADGTKLVFTRPTTCDEGDWYFYYYYDCLVGGLSAVTTEGGDPVAITSNNADTGGAWHPDGDRIAFTRGGRLYLANLDGSAESPVAIPAAMKVSDPVWSPDGLWLAFTCGVQSGNHDICVAREEGSGFARLTDDLARDARPAWSPDGASIAFVTNRFGSTSEIVIMSPDGSGLSRVAPGVGATHPAWSGSGALVFAGTRCDVYEGCSALGLFSVATDGSGLTQLTSGSDHAPSWRP